MFIAIVARAFSTKKPTISAFLKAAQGMALSEAVAKFGEYQKLQELEQAKQVEEKNNIESRVVQDTHSYHIANNLFTTLEDGACSILGVACSEEKEDLE